MKRATAKILMLCSLVLSFFVTGCDSLLSSLLDSIEQKEESSLFERGYITEEETIIETEHFIIEVDADVYIAPYVEENIEIIFNALEEVSGLKYYNEYYNNGKITIEVEKPNNSNSPDIEFGNAYAYSTSSTIHICSGDLLLGVSYALTHELSHILQYSQSYWHYNQVLVEGFAEYTSYKVSKYLEENNIVVAKTIQTSDAQISNTSIQGDIYSQTIEYWMQNKKAAYDISYNGGYAVGFRFMAYLDDVYGDYTRWIKYYENKTPYRLYKKGNQEVEMSKQLSLLKEAYGENVYDGFYKWLRNHEDMFQDKWNNDNPPYDLSKLDKTYIYPQFVYSTNTITMTKFYKFKYNDLYVDIDETRNYLENYKHKDVSNLKLKLEKAVKVELYDVNGNLLEAELDDEFSLTGVSYIKLVGENTLGVYGVHGLKIEY